MSKGLEGNMQFTSSLERKVTKRLSEIEKEDADRCKNCGGEDCICCEYYIDRQKWVSPEELFGEYNEEFYCNYDYDEDYDDEEWED